MLPHFSGNMRQDFVAVFHADLESRVGKAIHDYTFHNHGIRGNRGSRRPIFYLFGATSLLLGPKLLGDGNLLCESYGASRTGIAP